MQEEAKKKGLFEVLAERINKQLPQPGTWDLNKPEHPSEMERRRREYFRRFMEFNGKGKKDVNLPLKGSVYDKDKK